MTSFRNNESAIAIMSDRVESLTPTGRGGLVASAFIFRSVESGSILSMVNPKINHVFIIEQAEVAGVVAIDFGYVRGQSCTHVTYRL